MVLVDVVMMEREVYFGSEVSPVSPTQTKTETGAAGRLKLTSGRTAIEVAESGPTAEKAEVKGIAIIRWTCSRNARWDNAGVNAA